MIYVEVKVVQLVEVFDDVISGLSSTQPHRSIGAAYHPGPPRTAANFILLAWQKLISLHSQHAFDIGSEGVIRA